MTLREDHRPASPRHSDREGITSDEGRAPAALVLSGLSAISGAFVGCLLAGEFYASVCLLASVLLAGWIGWWARGLNDG